MKMIKSQVEPSIRRLNQFVTKLSIAALNMKDNIDIYHFLFTLSKLECDNRFILFS